MVPYFLGSEDGAVITTNRQDVPLEVHISISGDPRPQQRPRYRVLQGRVVIYSPDRRNIRIFRNAVRDALGLSKKSTIFGEDAFFEVDVHFNLRRPPSHFTRAGDLKAGVPIFPLAEGDVDNFDKFVLDGLQGVLYSDDRAVITLRSHKRYTDNQVGNTTIVVKRIQQ